jgi:uncharacterized protein (TIGR00369 family)
MAAIDQKAAFASLERAPFSAAFSLKIELSSEGETSVRMPFDTKLLNDGGISAPIHGGAIATLADFAACAAVWTLPETQRSATISLTVNYTGPGIKSDLVAHAKVRRKGKRIASVNVEIHDDAHQLIADALVTYKIA